jgi:hypothetical protein
MDQTGAAVHIWQWVWQDTSLLDRLPAPVRTLSSPFRENLGVDRSPVLWTVCCHKDVATHLSVERADVPTSSCCQGTCQTHTRRTEMGSVVQQGRRRRCEAVLMRRRLR